MGLFKPFTARDLAKTITEREKIWAELTDEQRASGEYIDPGEPVVLAIPDEYADEDEDNDKYHYYHIMSIGGGATLDDDGNDIGHDGFELVAMEIEQPEFFYNGRRAKK
jgi:hypothetical protein